MNKRYMDFVPAKSGKVSLEKKRVVSVPEEKRIVEKKNIEKEVAERKNLERRVEKARERDRLTKEAFSINEKNRPSLGVVEDFDAKFVKKDFPKRPLNNTSHFQSKSDELREAKSQKIIGKRVIRKNVVKTEKNSDSESFKTPNTPFINQEKVIKRPLSKNVYQKKVETPKEEPKGPVTIITKPEKDAHVNLIVTIIITIILGAAAGTVAFLLLPK